MGHGRRLAVALLLTACGPSVEASTSGDGDGSGDEASATASDSNPANTSAGSTSGDDPLTHGSVALEFRRSDLNPEGPALIIASFSVTMTYGECLTEFYDANPSMRQTGPDGEIVFGPSSLGGEGWVDRLCDASQFPGVESCTVAQIEQRLDPVAQLTVGYTIEGDLMGRHLRFGPLPTKETAQCLDPIVRVSVDGIVGQDAGGNTIVIGASVQPSEAITDQGAALFVELAPA